MKYFCTFCCDQVLSSQDLYRYFVDLTVDFYDYFIITEKFYLHLIVYFMGYTALHVIKLTVY